MVATVLLYSHRYSAHQEPAGAYWLGMNRIEHAAILCREVFVSDDVPPRKSKPGASACSLHKRRACGEARRHVPTLDESAWPEHGLPMETTKVWGSQDMSVTQKLWAVEASGREAGG